jgi:DNA helicase-2/ATP-dependent DNA helicase PcrA
MYVGITRAEEKLYLTSAKRRQTWGEYRYYNPSQFIDEIPTKLMDSYESDGYSSRTSSSTFRSAVSKAKQSYASSDTDGYVRPSSGFGSNFVAPKNRGLATSTGSNYSYGSKSYSRPQSNRTPQRTILVKSAANKKREQEKIDAFMKDNPVKRMADERRRQQEALRQQEIERQQQRESTKFLDEVFEVGQRVFHEKMGIGHVTDVMKIGESIMYTVDFGKNGKKAMDASYARLKKF